MKVKQKVYLYMSYEYDWDSKPLVKKWMPTFLSFEVEDDAERVFVGETEVTLDYPDDFDPVPKQVAAMQAERAKIVAEFTAKLSGIDEKLAQLQALTNEVR
jgi:hypothetical protein